MKIALIGYGKMGREIERVAQNLGHEIVFRLGREENRQENLTGAWLGNTQVLVDFSAGSAVADNVKKAMRAQLPIIVGTTGWQEQLDEVRATVEEAGGACLYSSNFSVGVQVLFHLTRKASSSLARFPEFAPYVFDHHHSEKRDAPSGTALKLLSVIQEHHEGDVPTVSLRAGYAPGRHTIGFDSPFDTLELRHTARSREGFARGVLFACQWIEGRKGFFNLEEVLLHGSDD